VCVCVCVYLCGWVGVGVSVVEIYITPHLPCVPKVYGVGVTTKLLLYVCLCNEILKVKTEEDVDPSPHFLWLNNR
jgi:hypothetical protein